MPLKPEGVTLENLSQYTITENGSVFTTMRGNRYLKGLTKPEGYKMYYLKDDQGNSRWYYAHRLVALAYIPNPLNKPDVDHIDNDKSNNHVSNLQWVTEAENIQLSFERGRTMPKGLEHWNNGKKRSVETRAKMSAKKIGENHPKFKGHYKYQDQVYSSMNALAKHLDTYVMTIKRMVAKGLVEFVPV